MNLFEEADIELACLLKGYLANPAGYAEELISTAGPTPDQKVDASNLQVGVPEGGLVLDSIAVEGFGIHEGRTSIDLRDGLNIVRGPNGAGKTTIISAVRWCLFGQPFGPHRGPVDGRSLLNWARAEKKEPEYRVSVGFRWGGAGYRAERKWKDDKTTFEVYDLDRKKRSAGLPEGLVPTTFTLMVFLGEVVMFISSGDPFSEVGPLKRAVWSFSGMDLLDGLEAAIWGAREALYKKLEVDGPKAARVEERILRTKGILHAVVDDRKKTASELEAIEGEMVKQGEIYRSSLDSLSRIARSKDEFRRNALKAAKATVVKDQLQDLLERSGCEILRGQAESALRYIQEEKEERTRRRILYGSYGSQASIVREIIRKKRCICSAPIGRSGMGKERLDALLKDLERSQDSVSDFGKELIWTSDPVLDQARRALSHPGFNRDDLRKKIRAHISCRKAAESIEKTGNNPEKQLSDCLNSIREYEMTKARARTLRERGSELSVQYRDLKREQDRLRSELLRIIGNDGRKGIRDRISWLDRGSSQLKRAQERVGENFLKDLCSKANEIAGTDAGRYSKIVIDPGTYEIGRTLRDGGRVVPLSSMSAGERELVSLSVLCAFPAMVGGNFVMDSPFAYMDGARRTSFLTSLCSFSDRIYLSIADGVIPEEDIGKLEAGSGKIGGLHVTGLGGGP